MENKNKRGLESDVDPKDVTDFVRTGIKILRNPLKK